jgi:hypothetical protein
MFVDPGTATIAAAILAAITAIIAAFIAKGRSERKVKDAKKLELERKEAEKLELEKLKTMADETSDRRAREAYSKIEILNRDGDSKTTMRWTGIKVSDGTILTHLSGRIWALTPGATIRNKPRLTTSKGFPKSISLVPTKDTPTEFEYNIEIVGNLTPKEPPLDYETEAELSKAVLMDKESVDAAYSKDPFKLDYHIFDVDFVIDRLTLEVVFPENFPVTAYASVFWGHTEIAYDAEFQRVTTGFKQTTRGGRFVIEKPRLSCRYLIYWTVPPKASLPAPPAPAAAIVTNPAAAAITNPAVAPGAAPTTNPGTTP